VVGPGLWHLRERLVVSDNDMAHISFVDTAEQAVAALRERIV
jgi:hypothetical protein